MAARIEPYQDTTTARVAVAEFLERSFREEGQCSIAQWQQRLAHWWDANPFCSPDSRKGWVLLEGEKVVGFLGVIPGMYEDAMGQPVPACIATSWAVDEEHRNSALAMAFQFQRLGEAHLLIDTTPSPAVQTVLRKRGWTEESEIERCFLLRRSVSRSLPDSSGHRIVSDAKAVKSIRRQEGPLAVGKRITPEYLRWYAASPMREHRFLGVADDAGELSSYIMATPQPVRGVPAWAVVDWFTTRQDATELHALVHALARHPKGWPGRWWPLICLTSFPPNKLWTKAPAVHRRGGRVCHFHWPPPRVKGQAKRTVLAEGDWGL